MFDVIIGNPPYQISDGGNAASAKPIYHKFIEQAIKMNPKYLTMIVPSRWMTGGKGLSKFRKKMLNDTRIKKIIDFTDADSCFPNVSIRGGVNYFLWDKDFNGLTEIISNTKNTKTSSRRSLNQYDIFIRDNFSLTILEKVLYKKEDKLNLIVSGQNPFGMRTFFKDFKYNKSKTNKIKLYGNRNLMKKTSGIGYINKDIIDKNIDLIKEHKVIIPMTGDTKEYGHILGKPIYSEPNSVCTETYVIVSITKSKEEAYNLIKYIKTKFFRFLIYLRKHTQHASRSVYSFVPSLDMKEEWTDEKLYKKYNLTEEEIKYIEESIAVME